MGAVDSKEMTYEDTIDYLYNSTPMFQNIGAGAYKPGLENVLKISEMYGNPHEGLKCIHVGGTNGKGSTAHTIAAILQSAGYKTGLFTSPHLTDFRERIRINGEMISRDEVREFVESFIKANSGQTTPSFFELTTIMAFEHFKRHDVDVAVIEVGLGGRLDCTNIISPDLSIITNISLDHTSLLGNTPEAIAREKAGIIKAGVPAVIGESEGAVRKVFQDKADAVGAPICYADDMTLYESCRREDGKIVYESTDYGEVRGELTGDCQSKNAATILAALRILKNSGYKISDEDVRKGFGNVCEMTGLTGRWMTVGHEPTVICDTGHNTGGWKYLSECLERYGEKLHAVIGFVNDKDVSGILKMLPRKAHYHFVQASVRRALEAEALATEAGKCGLKGTVSKTVAEGYEIALSRAAKGDVIFVGGSTFVVADFLEYINKRR